MLWDKYIKDILLPVPKGSKKVSGSMKIRNNFCASQPHFVPESPNLKPFCAPIRISS